MPQKSEDDRVGENLVIPPTRLGDICNPCYRKFPGFISGEMEMKLHD